MCHKIFSLHYLPWFEPIWAHDKQAKVFLISVSILPRYSTRKLFLRCAAYHGDNFVIDLQSRAPIFDNLHGVHHTVETNSVLCNTAEMISAVCNTPQSPSTRCETISDVCCTLRRQTAQCTPQSQNQNLYLSLVAFKGEIL